MKRVALGLLCAAALLYALASALHGQHPAWGYVAAFAEAAMVGAIADWFAVVALFRHPLGLPIPHTAIIPSNKDRIGAKLAGFICNNFLSTEQVLAKLRQFDAAGRLADWLARPASGAKLGEWGVAAARYGLSAFDDERVRAFMGRAAAAGLEKIDLSRLMGQALDALTAGGRHQALLDDVLQQVAGLLEGEEVQSHITEAIAREIKTLRYVGLDQVAAKLAARKIVAAVARTIAELAAEPDHPMRKRFDHFVDDFVVRLKLDPEFQQRGEQIRAELMAHPALGDYLHSIWGELLAWLHDDLAGRRGDPPLDQRADRSGRAAGHRALPRGHPPLHRGARRRMECERDDRRAGAPHRARPAVHPYQRHAGGRPGGAHHSHGDAAVARVNGAQPRVIRSVRKCACRGGDCATAPSSF
jgi:uncharacterized membrane-anchored protein YjiN (DUF445 family)